MPVTFERQLVVHGGACKKRPWVISSVEVIAGREYVELRKTDTGFSRFVAGAATDVRSYTFLDELRRLRTTATLQAMLQQSAPAALFDAHEVSKVEAKAVRKQTKTEAANILQVDVSLPAISGFAEMQMSCKASVSLQTNVAVELTPLNLEYIAAAMRESSSESKKRNRSEHSREGESKYLRWMPGRKCFVAYREDDRKRCKTFRPKTQEDLDIEDARSAAMQWAQGTGDSTDDGQPSYPAAEAEAECGQEVAGEGVCVGANSEDTADGPEPLLDE